MWFFAGQLTLVRPCVGVQGRTSLMSLSIILLLCPACLAYLIWMIYEMGDKWLYRDCFVAFCFQDLFKSSTSYYFLQICLNLPILLFSPGVLLKSKWCNHTVVLTWLLLKRISILFYQKDNLSIAVHALPMHMLIWFWVDEILLPRYMKWFTNFSDLPFNDEIVASWLKHFCLISFNGL